MSGHSVGDADLPGMWERADFEGGDPDERSYAERERARKREAAVQAMIAKGYTRERAEYLLFDVVGKAITRLFPPAAWDDPDHDDPPATQDDDPMWGRPIPPAACPCGHPSDDHDDGGACMHLCDCAWPIPPEASCSHCPPGCASCEPVGCECYAHQDEPDRRFLSPGRGE